MWPCGMIATTIAITSLNTIARMVRVRTGPTAHRSGNSAGVGGQYVLQHVQRGALAVVLLDRRHAQIHESTRQHVALRARHWSVLSA